MRRRCGVRPSLSLPPRDPAKVPGLAYPWSTVSPNNPEDGLICEAERAKARLPSFGCPSPKEQRPAVDKPELAANDAEARSPPACRRGGGRRQPRSHEYRRHVGRSWPYRVAASSGKEALDLIRQQGSVDLVITDYAMPHMTGLQLAEAIKKEWPELPVIVATGFAEMEPGAATTLPKLAKPFTQAELAHTLARIIQASRRSGRVLKFRPGVKPAV